ncbi:MAG: four helix bundle protein [Bacteroidota bacterium]|nr:four helix bundle protein [Bacteroidota bacterium]
MSEGKGTQSIIAGKAYAFALDIIKIYKQLTTETKEYVLSKQLLRAGTSIGANVNEAVSSESKRDFVHKLGIALKEARETNYWLSLLNDRSYITHNSFTDLNNNCAEIIRILSSIILTTKERYFKSKSSEL